jgi:three-Cys-motif partner protein
LKDKPFTRIYIDAFAGSGQFEFKAANALPLFNEREVVEIYAGSARHALATAPPFHRVVFIERKRKNISALRNVISEFPAAKAEIWPGDANAEVKRLCSSINWSNTRGVIFLDPFGNSVEWSTIAELGKTLLDVWYLFPLAGVYRNAPLDWAQLTPDKRKTITKIVGTTDWESRFYEEARDKPPDLFSTLQSNRVSGPNKRSLNVDGIENFVSERLKSVFPHVLKPRRLLGKTRAPMFSLFFAMANESQAAWKVGRPIAQHLLDKI